MKPPDPKLKKLVALKRQSAEQALLSVQQEANRLEEAIEGLNARLRDADDSTLDFEAIRLSRQEHFVEAMLGRIKALRAEREALNPRLEAARDALRKAIYSEGQLDRLASG